MCVCVMQHARLYVCSSQSGGDTRDCSTEKHVVGLLSRTLLTRCRHATQLRVWHRAESPRGTDRLQTMTIRSTAQCLAPATHAEGGPANGTMGWETAGYTGSGRYFRWPRRRRRYRVPQVPRSVFCSLPAPRFAGVPPRE